MRRSIASLGVAFLAVALASCGGDNEGPDLATIQVSPDPITLAQQQTSQLQVSVLDSDGLLVTGVSVTFSSADSQVATVTNTGLVSGGRAGSTEITVRASGLRQAVPVTVTAVSNAIIVSPNPGVVPQNGTLQLNAVVNDLNGLPISGAPLTFTSGTTSLATVSSSGLVTPVGPAGQVVITVSSGALSATVPVAISQVATTLVVSPNPVRMGKAATMQMSAVVKDRVGTAITGVVATYQSSNTALATISATGSLHGKGTTGALEIQVAAAGLNATVPVTLVDLGSPQGILDGTSAVEGYAYGIDISPAGVIAVSGTVTSHATLSNRTFTTLVPIVSSYQYAPAVALSGNSVWVSGVPDGRISEVDATTGTVLGTISGGNFADRYVLRFSADGNTLFGAGPGLLTVINRATRAVEREVATQSSGLSLALNPVGTTVFVGGGGPVQEVTPSTGTVRTVTSEQHTQFAITPDGQRLYLVSEWEAVVKLVQVSDGAVIRTIPVPCSGFTIGVSPDGQKVFIGCGPQVVILDVATDAVLQNITVGGNTRRIAFSADGLTAAVSNETLGVSFIR